MDGLFAMMARIEPMHWFAIAIAFLIAEIATGTTYLMWPAAAAALTAGLALTLPGQTSVQWAVFAIATVALTLTGHFYVRGRWLKREHGHAINERGHHLIGQHAHAHGAFANGVGSVKLNDTIWRAVSDEAVGADERVEILSVDGATLKVKRAG